MCIIIIIVINSQPFYVSVNACIQVSSVLLSNGIKRNDVTVQNNDRFVRGKSILSIYNDYFRNCGNSKQTNSFRVS